MTDEELICALREKASRDNRALLDEAADRIEQLSERKVSYEKCHGPVTPKLLKECLQDKIEEKR